MVLKLKQNFQKVVVTGKTTVFMIGPFCTPHLISLATDGTVLYANIAVSILVLSRKKQYSSFLNKVFVFQKIGFKVKVVKTFKISSDYHIKTNRSLKRKVILKIPSKIF